MYEATLLLGTGASASTWHESSRDASGDPVSLAGSPALKVSVNGAAGVASGVTLTVDDDGVTGFNQIAFDVDDATLALSDGDVAEVYFSAGTVDGHSLAGTVVGRFGITNGSLPAQAKLDVNAEADAAISDAALATAANLATVDTVVDAIKVVTDNLPNSGALTTLTGYVDELESRLTAVRAGLLDNLDVAVSTRSSHDDPDPSGYLDAAVSSRSSHAAGDIWDVVLTGAAHNDPTSAGRRLREIGGFSLWSGTAQAGSSNSITLDTGASATDDIYDNNLIVITGGTGAGQSRVIAEYHGTSREAFVGELWDVTPDATSEFQILAAHTSGVTHHGIAQAGTASTITLSSTASAQDDIYVNQAVLIRTSTGTGQVRLITDYNGTTKVATVSPDWNINPTSDSVYAVLPFGQSVAQSLATQAQTDAQTAAAAALAAYDAPTLTEIQTELGNLNDPTAAAIATQVWATVIENGHDAADLVRGIVSILMGLVSGMDSNAPVFRDLADSKNRISATTDADGNRTAITISDLS